MVLGFCFCQLIAMDHSYVLRFWIMRIDVCVVAIVMVNKPSSTSSSSLQRSKFAQSVQLFGTRQMRTVACCYLVDVFNL